MTDTPPPGPPPEPPPEPGPATPAPLPPYQHPAPQPATPAYAPVAVMAPVDRMRLAWQRRNESDYIFDFATALGWTILTCGIYAIYIVYQLVRRSRDHNLRRIELLDAATAFAWDRANERGLAEELRPNFEAIAQNMATLRYQTTQFREPVVWMVLAIVARGIVEIVAFVLLDGDLITHDRAEGAVEDQLSTIYTRLGAPIAPPDPARVKGPDNYIGRVVATLLTCGIYAFWWEYNVMTEGNHHFQENWRFEDDLAQSVQQLSAA